MSREPFVPVWIDDAGLSAAAFRVLMHLWRRRNRATGQCNPGAESIARVCRINEDTVWRALNELETKIPEQFKRAKGYRNSNQYVLTTPASVTGNGGVTQAGESPPISESTHRNARGVQSPETEGRKGTQEKVHNEGVCGSATSHTDYSGWVRTIQGILPKIEVADCLQDYLDHVEQKGVRPTFRGLHKWCARERERPRKQQRFQVAATIADEPPTWRSVFPDSQWVETPWPDIPPSTRESIVAEMGKR